MSAFFGSLSIEDLAEMRIRVLRPHSSSTRPAIIRLVEDNGMQGVVKDISAYRFIYQNTIGEFLL